MDDYVATLFVIALSVFAGQFIYNKVFVPALEETPLEVKPTSGDPVRDFMDSHYPD